MRGVLAAFMLSVGLPVCADALHGQWYWRCHLSTYESADHYEINHLSLTATTLTSCIEIFADPQCRNKQHEVRIETRYRLGRTFTTQDNDSVREITTLLTRVDGAQYEHDDYDIYRVEGDRLYFGKQDVQYHGQSEQARPQRLDRENVFVRQRPR